MNVISWAIPQVNSWIFLVNEPQRVHESFGKSELFSRISWECALPWIVAVQVIFQIKALHLEFHEWFHFLLKNHLLIPRYPQGGHCHIWSRNGAPQLYENKTNLSSGTTKNRTSLTGFEPVPHALTVQQPYHCAIMTLYYDFLITLSHKSSSDS